jgi:hypothetical protein
VGSTPRNGTSCGAPLSPGVDVPVKLGDTLHFGGPQEAWSLVDDSPPAASATDGTNVLVARDGLLVFPGDTHVVRLDPRAGWVLEAPEGVRALDDGASLHVEGVTWSLNLPTSVPPTQAAASRPELSLVLRVADDQVQVEVQAADVQVLRPRAHHQFLLTLARERQRARRRGVPEEEAGWVALTDLMTHLGISTNVGYVWWYRLREQLEQHGVGALVERRFSGEIRVADVPIEVA